MRLRLHHILFVCFALVSAVPVATLGLWVGQSVHGRELAATSDNQRVLVGNITAALARYATDLEGVFEVASSQAERGFTAPGMHDLLANMHILHLCVVDPDHNVDFWLALDGRKGIGGLGVALIEHLRATFDAAALRPGEVIFADGTHDYAGRPVVWLVRALDGGRFALAGVSTDYLAETARRTTFGKNGHAVIVDGRGRVLAHPREEWRLEMRDLSKLAPVAEMVAGRAGSTTFFSPATKADMLASYGTVPRAGWGAMVVLPLSEIEGHAAAGRWATVLVAFGGLAVSLGISWILARLLARPLAAVAVAAHDLAAGRSDARAAVPAYPAELREVGEAFNAMADQVDAKNADLAQALGLAEAANRGKSDFLANVSHEVRTPLTAILGFSALVRANIYGPVGHPKYKDYAEHIHASALHLLDLINAVLDLSKAESGMLDVSLARVDLAAAIAECLPMVQPQAREGEVRVACQIAANLPPALADAGRLKQVVLNLLSNAIKYTLPGGTIEIEAGRVEDEWLRVRVRDTGIGIAEGDIAKVLMPFGRVEGPWTRKLSGTGLGLPLSKKMVDAMGGRFTLDSTPGVGTVVTVELRTAGEPGGAATEPAR